MTQETTNEREDLEQLRQRFEEFRSTQTTRGRLPESLWDEAARAANRYGVNVVAHELRLDYSKLKRQMGCEYMVETELVVRKSTAPERKAPLVEKPAQSQDQT